MGGRYVCLLLTLWLCACSAQAMRSTQVGHAADPWQRWASDFDGTISACVREEEADCLPRGFAHPRPALVPEPSAIDILYRDLRTAEVLLGQEDAAALLAREYGIDPKAYLGTGHSVPVTGPGAYDYEYATQREFFVPNLCGDPEYCTPADPGVWIWKLSPAEVTPWLDEPMRTFTRQVRPVADAAGFRAAVASAGDDVAPTDRDSRALPLLVRFAIFRESSYRGLLGRPGTERVFFANYEALSEGTLRDALVGTGSNALIALARGEADPEQTFFMWIHRPAAGSAVRPATWDALFDALEERSAGSIARG
jgi:hypothetical protein